MNNVQKATVAEMLAVMSEVSGKAFSQAAIVHMVEAMSDLDYLSVMRVLGSWSKTEKHFPHPADIREKIMPEINPEDDAQDVANLVIGAISRFGYTNPNRARDAIGELAWETVKRMGGWKMLCETVTMQNSAQYRAQIRDYANTVRRKSLRGELEERTALPSSKKLISQSGLFR